jgi:N-methylhydantoinase A
MGDALREAFARVGIDGPLRFDHQVDMRFVGQAFEVPVAIRAEHLAELSATGLAERFRDAHHRVFEFGDSGHERAEIVSFRLGAATSSGAIPPLSSQMEGSSTKGSVSVFDRDAETVCRLMCRLDFPRGEPVAGPALVDDGTATIYVPSGWRGERDAHDNLVLRREAR